MEEIKIGKVYRHYKGNYYFVEGIGLDSETLEKMVIYKPLYNSSLTNIWVRKETSFLEEIDANMPGNVTGQKVRYELCEDLIEDRVKR